MTQNRFQWRAFGLLHMIVLLLLVSWFWQDLPFRGWWDSLDRRLFFALNGSMEGSPASQKFWAIANHRAFDLVSAVLVLALFAIYALRDQGRALAKALAQFLLFFLFTLCVIEFAKLFLDIGRKSPSLVLEPVLRLSELVPEIRAKDASGNSFPGDHATVLMIYTGYLWKVAGRRYGIAMVIIAILFVLPRVVGGAHWATDVLVGGLSVALFGLAWLFATPLFGWLEHFFLPAGRWLERLLRPLLRLFRLVPRQ